MARTTKPSPLEHKDNIKRCRKWRLYINMGYDSNGNRVKTSRRFEGTYTEAMAELRRLEAELKVPKANNMTLAQYCDDWLERRRNIIATSTFYRNMKDVRNIKHLFGEEVLLRAVTVADIEDKFLNQMLTKGAISGKPCSPRYVNSLMSTMSSIMKDAVRYGYIRSNPIEAAKRPIVRTAERDVPTPEETQQLLSQLDPRDGRQMCIFLAASMGLRRGEALGLNWGDVDFAKKQVSIRRVCRKSTEIVDQPKTDSSRRTLPMTDWIVEAFRDRERIAKDDLAHARKAGRLNSVKWADMPVCSKPDCERVSTEMATRWWGHNRKKLGLTCTLHDLRHAYLSTLAVTNVPVRVIMALAGHSSPTTTLEIYAHANMDAKFDAAATISGVLDPKKKPKKK